ncbi:MAG: hypothetical protein LIP77_02690 [Planctomycetes bacterium]|nr:hypothetical protein [Planctomycetota bacterium]
MIETPGRTVLDLQQELSARSGQRVLLCLTGNRRRMLSARRHPAGHVEVRLQKIFLAAPPEVLDEIACLLRGEPSDRQALRRFTAAALAREPAAARPRREPSPERSRAAHHDIVAYARRLNQTYLGGRSTARVVWGRRGTRRGRRSIRFACYDPERNLVIMNRKLDSPDIPAYFVEYVLFHELLHEVLGIGRRADGRRDIHGSLFKLMESTYPDFAKAVRFEKELCTRLETL